MTTVNGSNYSSYTSNTTDEVNTKNNQTLMKDDFLKLFITQLKNQDPLSPVDDSQFLAQLAQFSSLEQMSNVAESVEALNKNMTALTSQSLLVQGAAMIGKEAIGIGEDGLEVSGIISSVKLNGAALQVVIGDKLIDMENIVEIKEAGTVSSPEDSTEETVDESGSVDNTVSNDGAELADTTDTTDTTETDTQDSVESP